MSVEDLDNYLYVFGVPCTRQSDSAKFRGVVDAAEAAMNAGFDGVDNPNERELFFRTDAVSLNHGDVLTVGTAIYRVRGNPVPVDDAAFSVVGLIK